RQLRPSERLRPVPPAARNDVRSRGEAAARRLPAHPPLGDRQSRSRPRAAARSPRRLRGRAPERQAATPCPRLPRAAGRGPGNRVTGLGALNTLSLPPPATPHGGERVFFEMRLAYCAFSTRTSGSP